MDKKAIVVGGSNGIGLAFVNKLETEGYSKIYIFDKEEPDFDNTKAEFIKTDLTQCNFDIFDKYQDIDTLIITAGFGRLSHFNTANIKEIENTFKVNSIAVINIIHKFYKKLISASDFNCIVMGSIAGFVSSPLFSLYAATKASVCRFVESINIEIENYGSSNRILNISPGSLNGTKFNGGENDISVLSEFIDEAYTRMKNKDVLYIPEYDSIYKDVLERYFKDNHKFGMESYKYKLQSNRINEKTPIKIGYLSGTFDLFHIGHLNLLKRAKAMCDYLVVGIHKDASHKGKTAFIPFDERMEIIKSIKYVDRAVESCPEDMDMYKKIKFDYLFVGSDYKGTERFNRYEEYFKDKNVEIVYFPYTQGSSSTQIRDLISKEINNN